MDNFNLRCEKFKQQLIDNINSSNLPISSVYYIYKLIEKDLENTYYGSLNSETIEQKETEVMATKEENK